MCWLRSCFFQSKQTHPGKFLDMLLKQIAHCTFLKKTCVFDSDPFFKETFLPNDATGKGILIEVTFGPLLSTSRTSCWVLGNHHKGATCSSHLPFLSYIAVSCLTLGGGSTKNKCIYIYYILLLVYYLCVSLIPIKLHCARTINKSTKVANKCYSLIVHETSKTSHI